MKSLTSLSKRTFTLGLFALSCIGISTAAHAEDALANIMKTKTIKIAVPTDYPPYGFVGADMQPQGLDIDMAKIIANKLGAKLELLPVISANRIPYVQTGKADLTISTLASSPEREKVIDFSASYSPFFQAVYGPKDLSIKSWDDVKGKSVAVVRGAMEDQGISQMVPEGADIKRFEDNNATVAAFVAKRTQLIATSGVTAALMAQKNPHLNAEFKLLLKETRCRVGIAKDQDALKAKVNEIIAEAKANGTLNNMSKKWLGRESGDLPL